MSDQAQNQQQQHGVGRHRHWHYTQYNDRVSQQLLCYMITPELRIGLIQQASNDDSIFHKQQ